MRLAPTLLRAWLAAAPPELRLEEELFDAGAVTQGLLSRVESADDWVISARVPVPSNAAGQGGEPGGPCPRPDPAHPTHERGDDAQRVECSNDDRAGLVVDVSLRRPDGTLLLRRLTLEATDTAGRSRELASLLAVLIEGGLVGEEVAEEDSAPTVAPESPAEQVASPPTQVPTPQQDLHPMDTPAYGPIRWLVVEARLGYGDARLRGGAVLDGGVGLSVGGRVLGDHLLVRGGAAWSRSARPTLAMDGFRIGAGIGAGGSLWRRRVWLGGDVTPHLLIVRISDVGSTVLTSSSVELAGHAQLGVRRFTFNVRAGVDLVFPPLVGIGRDDALAWGGARFFTTAGVGARF